MATDSARLVVRSCYTAACLLFLHACTSLPPTAIELDTLPPTVELSHTPFFAQSEHHCGPAALATVLQSHDVQVTPETLSSRLYIPARKGSLQIEMSAASRRYGMLPYPLQPGLTALLTEVAAGNVVLVLQNKRFSWWPQWHYAVVIGYDINAEELILRSGTTKRWQTSFRTFNNTWQRAGQWALVIVPAGSMPATASSTTYLETVYALEQTGQSTAALAAYRKATQHWPENATAWLALGNLAYNMELGDEAVSALVEAASRAPDSIAAWNNLAYALKRTGCKQQAADALQCAYRLSPGDQNIRDSEEEIQRMPLQSGARSCPQISCN